MIEKQSFGKLSDGTEVYVYTLENDNGMKVKVTNYGAAVVSIIAPDKNGKFSDVVLGYDSAADYEKCSSYIGTTVGRYGNRIGKGKFEIDGTEFQVSINDGNNHLHGGKHGYNKRVWEAEMITGDSYQSIKLTLIDKDGEQGFPGEVKISVTYTLNNKNELVIDYSGTADKPTILNPTNHSYFNLSGDPKNNILNHTLKIEADYFTPVDSELITTGELRTVQNSPFDFRTPKPIGQSINEPDEQLKFGKGYDHNWVLKNYDKKIRKAAELADPESGRLLEIFTDQPGIQFYSGNFLDGSIKGKNSLVYNHRTGLCLETQHFPDTPNKKEFPSVRINPGENYIQKTIYKFSIK